VTIKNLIFISLLFRGVSIVKLLFVSLFALAIQRIIIPLFYLIRGFINVFVWRSNPDGYSYSFDCRRDRADVVCQ
jgi:hypothetical protein